MMNKKKYSIKKDKNIEDALKCIELTGLGVVFIEDRSKIIGVVTDGDIRRALIKRKNLNMPLTAFMNKEFVFLRKGTDSRENILKLLDSRIKVIPILDNNDKLVKVVSAKHINWNESGGIISKAKSPVRITFAGGGTDLTAYFYESNGIVFNATINKFTHAVLEKRDDSKIIITSHDLKEVIKVDDISKLKLDGSLDLIKSIIMNLSPDFGFNLYTYSDVPPGSGLGGSAVLASAIIGAFNNFREIKLDVYEIVKIAFHSERIVLELNGGWQDQYATVFGCFIYIEFNNSSNTVNPLRIKDNIKDELEDSLLLCYTGKNHNSGNIHNDIRKKMRVTKEKAYAQKTKEIAYQMKSSLLQGKIDDFGKLLGQAWEAKKKFSAKISNKFLDGIYDYAIKSGATGGKLLGAGDGGYFLFYVPTHKKIDFINAIKKRKLFVEPFTFDDNGLRSWTTKNKI